MPPLVGVAVKVTFCPAQMDVAVDVILTDGVTEEFTVNAILLLVAGLPVTFARLDVILQVIGFEPAASVVVLNVEEVAPEIALPLSYHW